MSFYYPFTGDKPPKAFCFGLFVRVFVCPWYMLKACEHDIFNERLVGISPPRFTTSVQVGTEMNWLHFEVQRSKVKVTARLVTGQISTVIGILSHIYILTKLITVTQYQVLMIPMTFSYRVETVGETAMDLPAQTNCRYSQIISSSWI